MATGDDGCAGCITASAKHPCLAHGCTAPCDTHFASLAMPRRQPTVEDFDAWMREVYDGDVLDDEDEDHDWNTLALGFLLARGVDPTLLGWDFLSSYTCADKPRMEKALARILNGERG